MTTIYLIRHAEAEGNLYGRSQGQYDANLTPLGLRQTAALAERFRGVPIDALWSSDLHRTMSTASAITKYHPSLEMHTTPALREINIGVWEDIPWGNLARDDAEQMTNFQSDPENWHVRGGEPFADVLARVKGALIDIAAQYDGRTVAVFSHGLCIRLLLCSLQGISLHEIGRMSYGDNTAVTTLEIEGDSIRLIDCNDASHLHELSTFARQGRDAQFKPVRNRYPTLSPLDPVKEAALYNRCYAATWMCSHGNLKAYDPTIYQYTAEIHAKEDPACVTQLLKDGKFAGLIELDPDHGRDVNAGWISLIYVEPDLRGQRIGVQLLGHAVSYFRHHGRSCIRLSVSETNTQALGFYRACGFRPLDTIAGVGGRLYRMEMDITQRVMSI